MKCSACGNDNCPCDKNAKCNCSADCPACSKKKEGKKSRRSETKSAP